jgi:F0F1-type ATP synthase membrane subunit b/b'
VSRAKVLARSRLVVAAFIVAILALTTALALAQEHHSGAGAGAAKTGEHHGDANATEGQESEHAEHGGVGSGHHGPAPINWTDIWDKKRPAFLALVINFGVLMTLYYMLGKKPVAEALKQRRVTIGKDIDEAQALLDEAKERAKKYQAELNSADADASTAKAALISAGKGEVDHILLEAQERADRMKRDADRLVEQERKQMQVDLLKETVDLAVREAAQILEKSVTADDHARLAQDLLLELARRPAAATSGRARSARPGGAA